MAEPNINMARSKTKNTPAKKAPAPKGVAPKGVAPKGVAPKGVAPKGVAKKPAAKKAPAKKPANKSSAAAAAAKADSPVPEPMQPAKKASGRQTTATGFLRNPKKSGSVTELRETAAELGLETNDENGKALTRTALIKLMIMESTVPEGCPPVTQEDRDNVSQPPKQSASSGDHKKGVRKVYYMADGKTKIKNATSAYIFFGNTYREEHGVSGKEAMTLIGAAWKDLNARAEKKLQSGKPTKDALVAQKELQKYAQMNQDDKARYEKEKKAAEMREAKKAKNDMVFGYKALHDSEVTNMLFASDEVSLDKLRDSFATLLKTLAVKADMVTDLKESFPEVYEKAEEDEEAAEEEEAEEDAEADEEEEAEEDAEADEGEEEAEDDEEGDADALEEDDDEDLLELMDDE